MTTPNSHLASPVREHDRIAGVLIVPIHAMHDERGSFMETFRAAWFPDADWSAVQSNRSDSKAGVLRGLHFHHHQVDYWYVPRGHIRVGLADLRVASPTFRATAMLDMGDEHNVGLYIPCGVAHGYLAVTDSTLTYVVNKYYDGGLDEHGVAWNDPDLGLTWGIETPIISPRDQRNPLLRDIPVDKLPR